MQSLERGIAVIQVFSREHPVAHAQRGRPPDRNDPRDGAADPADARAARPRALRRAAVLAHAARAHPRLGLPVLAEPLGDRAAAHGGPRRADARVVLGRDARPPRHRLRGPRADAPDHDHRARRRDAAARPTRRRWAACCSPTSPPSELDAYSRHDALEPFTDAHGRRARTPCWPAIAEVREQGWALVDQELEIGLRSVAAPIRGRRAADDGRAERFGCGPESLHRGAQNALPAGTPAHGGTDLREPRAGVAYGFARLGSRASATCWETRFPGARQRGRALSVCLC